MCGVIGIVGQSNVNQALFDGLTVLQHRGQDAAGIMTCEVNRLHLVKNLGLLRDVILPHHMLELRGNMGIGHVRYPTAGCATSPEEAQPFYVNMPYGIAMAHNGNLVNVEALQKDIYLEDRRHVNTDSDSEVLLNVFAHELQLTNGLELTPQDIFDAIRTVHKRCSGAYAVVAMIAGVGIVGFRDPHGIRPLMLGLRLTDNGTEYMLASESVALNALGFSIIKDVEPGEAVFIPITGGYHTQQCADKSHHSPCIFEFVYFARPDSKIDEISVYKARLRMGKYLAYKIRDIWPEYEQEIDVVIPIPETSRTSALELATTLNLKYREGFIKNRYIGRTFIMPGQTQRKKSVKQKLNAIDLEFRGKSVLLVDDSIVRGTTSQQIIQIAREAGAKKVYMASAAPPVRYPNVYGIDMPAAKDLIAHNRTEAEIAKIIGADKLIYQNIEDLILSVQEGNSHITEFDTSCFTGEYVTKDITETYLIQLQAKIENKEQEATMLATQKSSINIYNRR